MITTEEKKLFNEGKLTADQLNIILNRKEELNIPLIFRVLIIVISAILIGIIWLLIIPYYVLGFFLIFNQALHEFDIIMEPYYWIYRCWNNEKL